MQPVVVMKRRGSVSYILGSLRAVVMAAAFIGCLGGSAKAQISPSAAIQHIVIIMQENRSFDHYFGTFPGADGIPQGVCVPNNVENPTKCVSTFHDYNDRNAGAPHRAADALADIDGGAMDGFVEQQQKASGIKCKSPNSPDCAGLAGGIKLHDVMGYHNGADIPNYWTYAHTYLLQDRMFEPVASYSLPAHLYLTSEWSAKCDTLDPTTCATQLVPPFGLTGGGVVTYPWTDLSYLLDAAKVSWKYYLSDGEQPDCADGGITCEPQSQTTDVLSIWNPMPSYSSVKAANTIDPSYKATHIVPTEQFLSDVNAGTLPAVSWIVPTDGFSEHPPNSVQTGMVYVSSLINAIMQTGEPGWRGPNYWANTVIILAWDDWGGFYDHVVPPLADTMPDGTQLGYGLRVPSIIIGRYVKAGTIDHQTMSFDAYVKFIEDIFLQGQRLDPKTDGRPDSRPDIRESLTTVQNPQGYAIAVGDLMNDFDFSQAPLAPLLQPVDLPLNVSAKKDSAPLSATISWSPVITAIVAGYNVQRSIDPEVIFARLPACSGVGFVAISCTDTDTPPDGEHFYYAVSTIAADGTESPNSTVVQGR